MIEIYEFGGRLAYYEPSLRTGPVVWDYYVPGHQGLAESLHKTVILPPDTNGRWVLGMSENGRHFRHFMDQREFP